MKQTATKTHTQIVENKQQAPQRSFIIKCSELIFRHWTHSPFVHTRTHVRNRRRFPTSSTTWTCTERKKRCRRRTSSHVASTENRVQITYIQRKKQSENNNKRRRRRCTESSSNVRPLNGHTSFICFNLLLSSSSPICSFPKIAHNANERETVYSKSQSNRIRLVSSSVYLRVLVNAPPSPSQPYTIRNQNNLHSFDNITK